MRISNRPTILALVIAGTFLIPSLAIGAVVAIGLANHGGHDGPQSLAGYVAPDTESVLYPACDDDAPDPSMTVPCVWNDDTLWVVMDGKGGSEYLPSCRTEDDILCVWDSAERGNRSESHDSPTRFVVNASVNR